MRALTICQPYAELIRRGEKRVENRRWETSYRGLLLIHAGKSRQWLDLSADGLRDEQHDIPLNEMDFGAIVAVADLMACLSLRSIRWVADHVQSEPPFGWVATHEHTEGPFCWVLENIRSLEEPIPCNGKQGLWIPDQSIIDRLPTFATAV